jgi:NAD(P)-dependent dehydrogenase (short-subunit alcohol dehydrogenase family)
VIMACRSVEKAEEAAKEIREATKDIPGAGTVHVVKLDLGSLASVRQCASELLQTESRINLLVNNAGRTLGSRRWTMVLMSKGAHTCTSVARESALVSLTWEPG